MFNKMKSWLDHHPVPLLWLAAPFDRAPSGPGILEKSRNLKYVFQGLEKSWNLINEPKVLEKSRIFFFNLELKLLALTYNNLLKGKYNVLVVWILFYYKCFDKHYIFIKGLIAFEKADQASKWVSKMVKTGPGKTKFGPGKVLEKSLNFTTVK